MPQLTETPWAERITAELETPAWAELKSQVADWGRARNEPALVPAFLGLMAEAELLAKENHAPSRRQLRAGRDLLIGLGAYAEISREDVTRTIATFGRSPVHFRHNGKPYVSAA